MVQPDVRFDYLVYFVERDQLEEEEFELDQWGEGVSGKFENGF